MRCISVYTNNLSVFSVVCEKILAMKLSIDEETEIDGITVSDAGLVDERYIEKMRQKPEVAVLRVSGHKDVTILRHGDVFEIIMPDDPATDEIAQ